jgi:prepilin signal peptidase PulO-like enzyme (type II secretory pathway)
MCGAFLGLKLTLFVLFAAPILGALYAVGWMGINAMRSREPAMSGETHLSTAEMLRSGEVPFGVFLGASALLAVVWGERAWDLYLAWAKLS